MGDYMQYIVAIVLTLFFGLLMLHNYYRKNLYLVSISALGCLLGIKNMQFLLYKNIDDNNLINIVYYLLVLLIGYFLIIQDHNENESIKFEYPTLIFLAIFGLFLTMENSEGLVMFLGLEIQAFTFYCLVSLKNKEIFSAEGALKYFLIGALASGLIILGLGLLYANLANTNFVEISEILGKENLTLKIGFLIIIIGLLFKIGAAPFHLWLPDAYQAAPFYVLLFLIVFPKLGLFHLLFNIHKVFPQNYIIVFALISTTIIGSIQAVMQTKIKRFISYSVIYNNGFFLSLVLLSGISSYFFLTQSMLLYFIVTLTTSLSFFFIRNANTHNIFLNLRDLVALKKSNGAITLILLLGFFSAAGVPPLLGFFQKYLILLGLTEKLQTFLMIFLILGSILPAYYYIRMSTIVFFLDQSKYILMTNISRLGATSLSVLLLAGNGIFY